MLRNYFKTAFRHLLRNKLYSAINVVGLATGITCTLLAVLYWKDEHSFDEFHQNNPYLYRVTSSYADKNGDRGGMTGNTGHVHGPAFKAGVPELKAMTRVLGGDIGNTLVHDNKAIAIKPLFVDSTFFDVFTFSFLRGNPSSALKAINSVVVTESTARKFFNSIDVVGRLFTLEADPSFMKMKKNLVVTAVVRDVPGNSSLQFDALFTFNFMELSFQNNNWFGGWLGTFVVLRSDADRIQVMEKFNTIYDAHAKAQLNDPEYNWNGFDPKVRYGLQPMSDVHFNTYLATNGWNEGGVVNPGSPLNSFAFMGIALFMLLMASINFINISIAGSLKRAKEVGIRKISGSNSRQIIFQFLFESAVLCLSSFIVAMAAMNLLLPLFNQLTGKRLLIENIYDGRLLLYFISLLLLVTLLTGLYPAFLLSRFQAAKVLYNRQKSGNRNLPGRGLVVVQFSLAVFLVTGAIIYYSQMNFIRTKDLGYNPSFMISTEVNGDRGDYGSLLRYIKNELAKEPAVKIASFGNYGGFEDIEVNGRSFSANNKTADENFLPLMDIPVLAGRNFSVSDQRNAALVNEAFVKAAGLQQPIGQTILVNRGYDSVYKTIVGVFKDYHFSSLREPIKPMMLRFPEQEYEGYVIWAKFEKQHQQKALAALEKAYKGAIPTALYQFHFIDEKNARDYIEEQRWHRIINMATLLAFILCSLGLFGLAHLSTHQRVKEIGVRKVLGASLTQIVSLFTFNFLKLVFISLIIAFPPAWIAAHNWLMNFAYRVDISWWMFVLAAFIAVIVAIAAVSVQAIRAAMANPVKSLRTE